MSQLESALSKWWAAKQVAEEVAAELEAAKEELIVLMDDQGLTDVSTQVDDQLIKAKIVRGTRIVIDEAKLKKTLGAAKWKKITKMVMDKDLLEAHVATGDIDANEVAMCSEEHSNRPYIRATAKTAVKKRGRK